MIFHIIKLYLNFPSCGSHAFFMQYKLISGNNCWIKSELNENCLIKSEMGSK